MGLSRGGLCMKDQFVPYELAVKLKELVFDSDYLAWYSSNMDFHFRNMNYPNGITSNCIKALLWQQAFDYFREKHYLISIVFQNDYGYSFEIHSITSKDCIEYVDKYSSYEKARTICLERLIEIIENGKD